MNTMSLTNSKSYKYLSVADPGFGQGGAKNFFRDFADVVKRSPAGKENNIIFQYKRILEF